MFWPAAAANGSRGPAPSVGAGSVGENACPNLKSVFTGWSVVVERSLLSAHGCPDVQDEDPGAARQLRRGEGRRRRPGLRQADLRGRSPAGPDSAHGGKQLGR